MLVCNTWRIRSIRNIHKHAKGFADMHINNMMPGWYMPVHPDIIKANRLSMGGAVGNNLSEINGN